MGVEQVCIGGRYRTVVTGRETVVRILSARKRGWWAENETTGRTVWVKDARQLSAVEEAVDG